MVRRVEVEVDEQGRITIPTAVRDRLALKPGMTLVVEQEPPDRIWLRIRDDEARLVEKDGVLVVEGELIGDVDDALRRERDARVDRLVRQAMT
ncbi:MAG: AbrB/MazE/SpoVT family DNA-binding domain-containing protein [Planctomycetaceae bacterium]